MNDPFFNLYNIIIDTCQNNKFNIDCHFFKNLGDNNPLNFVDKNDPRLDLETEIQYLLRRKIIFHDQEPIIFKDQIKEWDCKIGQVNRLSTSHILSNSELNSVDKDILLSKSGWADFYWFSNGFLSLEWYRYYRYANYFENMWQPTKTFSSYNRLLPNREHRHIIADHLYTNFPNQIVLSKHSDDVSSNLFINTHSNKSENLSYTIHEKDFIDSFCHVVTERIYYEDRIHLTEKSFRPIICCRPFILVSSPGTLAYLKNYGFKTFSEYWDESYDETKDHSLRMSKILKAISYLGSLSHSEMLNMLNDMYSILIYNRNHFYNLFQKTITTELFNNLQNALNNHNSLPNIFSKIIANLTIAEIEYIQNPNIVLDIDNPDEDYFQMDMFSKALNNRLNKTEIDESTIRPFVAQYARHFKYYYLCLKKLKQL